MSVWWIFHLSLDNWNMSEICWNYRFLYINIYFNCPWLSGLPICLLYRTRVRKPGEHGEMFRLGRDRKLIIFLSIKKLSVKQTQKCVLTCGPRPEQLDPQLKTFQFFTYLFVYFVCKFSIRRTIVTTRENWHAVIDNQMWSVLMTYTIHSNHFADFVIDIKD